jgi:hypothetical protein
VIEHYPRGEKGLALPGGLILELQSRAYLGCGCQCFVGNRTDNRELTTAMFPCSPAHLPLGRHANLLLRESLVQRQARLLVDVVDELLQQAQRYAEVT